jgi:hypothetical protein
MGTPDQYARIIIDEGRRRGITDRGIKIALATAIVESSLLVLANDGDPASLNYPHDGVGHDYDSVGLFQQRPPWGSAAVRMDPAGSAGLFYAALARLNYNSSAHSAGWYAAEVQRPAAQYRGRYDEEFPGASRLYDRLGGGRDDSFSDADRQSLRWVADRLEEQQSLKLLSRSPFRALGEEPLYALDDFELNQEANIHVLVMERLAAYGDSAALQRLQEVGVADPTIYPDRAGDIKLAQRLLAVLQRDRLPYSDSCPSTRRKQRKSLAAL